jgi:DNA invertase Pin-like site-specific DNA recombinase
MFTTDQNAQKAPQVRAALYVRAACITQTTLDEQRKVLERYAEQNNLRVVRRYIEGGFSGRTQGPKQKEMLEAVLAGTADFSVILMRDVTRWGRWDDADLSAYYEFMCLREGIRVRYMEEENRVADKTDPAALKKVNENATNGQ